MGHWAAVGLLFHMSQIELSPGSAHYPPSPYDSDKSLAYRLKALADNPSSYHFLRDDHIDVTSSPDDESEMPFPFPLLLSASNTTPPIVYTNATFQEFHCLLIKTLLAYAKGLQVMQNNSGDMSKRIGIMFSISRLLNTIVYSNAFKSHINFLNRESLLRLPTFDQFPAYCTFADKSSIYINGKERGKAQAGDTEKDDVGNDNAGDDDGDEFQIPLFILPLHRGGIARSWIKLLVKHFAAKRILEDYCQRMKESPDPVQISVLAVPHKSHDMPSWVHLQSIIKDLLSNKPEAPDNSAPTSLAPDEEQISDNEQPSGDGIASNNLKNEEVIAFIESRFLSESPTNKMFRKFHDIITGKKVLIQHSIHCEAALAAFASGNQETGGEDLRVTALRENLDRSAVAVSKLCCPACWELMDILGDSSGPGYQVRGRHSTVFPVRLPPWLDEGVIQKLVTRFEQLLREQLSLIKSNLIPSGSDISIHIPRTAHKRTPSSQSESNFTNVSGSSKTDSDEDFWDDDMRRLYVL